jgi:hypothetical protein
MMRTAARITLTALGGAMLVLGLIALAYGLAFMYIRFFVFFNAEQTALIGLLSAVAGVALIVFARRGLGRTR